MKGLKNQICTVPNLLSAIRLILVPVIVLLYRHQAYSFAAAVIIVSALTDFADGRIARKYHSVSELGKVLDPVADKLTQIAVVICLIGRYRLMGYLTVLFVAKEIFMGAAGLLVLRKFEEVNGAKWHGKACTVMLYGTVMALLLFPDIPSSTANILIAACMLMVVVSLVLYIRFYRKFFREKGKQKKR